MTSRRVAAIIVIPLLAVSMAACASTPPVAAPTATEVAAEPTTEPTPEPTPEPTSDCITVAQSTIDAINTGVTAIDPGNSITDAYAIKAGERENVYFVAANIIGDGIGPGDAQALWATNDDVTIDPHSGLTFSVDGFAKQFSNFPDGGTSSAALTANEDGAQEALDCIPQ